MNRKLAVGSAALFGCLLMLSSAKAETRSCTGGIDLWGDRGGVSWITVGNAGDGNTRCHIFTNTKLGRRVLKKCSKADTCEIEYVASSHKDARDNLAFLSDKDKIIRVQDITCRF